MADDLVTKLDELFDQCQPNDNDVADIRKVLEVLTNSQEVSDVIDEQLTQELCDLFVDGTDGSIARNEFISRIKQVIYPVQESSSSSSSLNGELPSSTPASERGQGDDIPWLRRRSLYCMSSFSSADISQPLDTSDSPRKEMLANLVRFEAQNKRLQDSLQRSQETCFKMANDHDIELAVIKRRLNDVKTKNKSLKEELKMCSRKAETAEALEIEVASAHRTIGQLKEDLAKAKISLTEAKNGMYSLSVENEGLKKEIAALRSRLHSEEQLLFQIEQLRADKQQILETYSDNAASAIPNFVELDAENVELTPDGRCCIPDKIGEAGGHVSIDEELTAIKSNFLTAQDKNTMCDIPQLVNKHTQTLPSDNRSVGTHAFCYTSNKATSCNLSMPCVHVGSQTPEHQPFPQNKAVQEVAHVGQQKRFSFRRILLLIFAFFFCVVFVKNPWTTHLNLIVCQGITDFFRRSIGYRPHPY